jgi:hypothetical protein
MIVASGSGIHTVSGYVLDEKPMLTLPLLA